MFLDDELLEIAKSSKLESKEDYISAHRRLLDRCNNKLRSSIPEDCTSYQISSAAIGRIINSWKVFISKMESIERLNLLHKICIDHGIEKIFMSNDGFGSMYEEHKRLAKIEGKIRFLKK